MTTGQVLQVAAARVRIGWCQGRYSDGDGGVCATGAVIRAGTYVEIADLMRPAELAIKKALNIRSVEAWNDAKGQTQENVAQGLEFAALYADQQDAAIVEPAPITTEVA